MPLQTLLKFGKIDILVSNAAVNPTFGPTLEVKYNNEPFFYLHVYCFRHLHLPGTK